MVNQVKEQSLKSGNSADAGRNSFISRASRLISEAMGVIQNGRGMDIAVDLGTCSTIISLKGHGIVVNEPSVIAVDKHSNDILNGGDAVGTAAHVMIGKTPRSIATIRPMRDGVIGDFQATEAMLASFIRRIKKEYHFGLVKPRVTIAVPCQITEVQKRAVIDSAERIGAGKVLLVQEPLAAGLGAGLPIANPTATMIVDIGGGTTDVAIISLADVAVSRSVRAGGDLMDVSIIEYVKKHYNLEIGPQRAEQLKIDIGSACPMEKEISTEILGRDANNGLPRSVTITSEEIREALKPAIAEIIEAVADTLQNAAPELAADLIDNGIHICGGGSMLRNIDKVLQVATGIDVMRVDEPLLSVAKGTQTYMENIDLFADADHHLN